MKRKTIIRIENWLDDGWDILIYWGLIGLYIFDIFLWCTRLGFV